MALIYDKALYDAHYVVNAWPWGQRNQPIGLAFHYNWWTQAGQPNARLKRNVTALTGGPGWAQLSDIAIIGGGFGWTAELLLDFDPTLNIINVEISPHVNATLGTSEEADLRAYITARGLDPDAIDFLVDPNDPTQTLTNAEAWAYFLRPDGLRTSITTLDNDLGKNPDRRAVRTALGGNIDALVTEIALDSHETEAEIDAFLDVVDKTRPNPACTAIHLIEYTPLDLGYISKTGPDWRIYLDAAGYSDHVVVDVEGNIF